MTNLDKNISKLKSIVSNLDTVSLLRKISLNIYTNDSSISGFSSKTNLESPYKQYLYLAGILLSTPQKNTNQVTDRELAQITQLLNEVSGYYKELLKESVNTSYISTDTKEINQSSIAHSVFMYYFNTAFQSTREQQVSRIYDFFSPFSHDLEQAYKLSLTDLVNINSYIFSELIKQEKIFNKYASLIEKEGKIYAGLNSDKLFKVSPRLRGIRNEFDKFCSTFFQISISDLKKQFTEEIICRFLDIFSIKRQERDFYYYTDKNPVEDSPIYKVSEEYIYCPFSRYELEAIYRFLYKFMQKSSNSERFYKYRDKQVESQVKKEMEKLFKNDAVYYSSIYENNKSHHEHDIIVILENTLIIIEVKAFKLKEPLRNAEKSFLRIKTNFKEIQKAYEQGLALKKLILSNSYTQLYDKKGNCILTINKEKFQDIHIICLTNESMGVITSNLSFLLEKPISENYPWCCNLYDLQSIIDYLIYKNISSEKLIEYLQWRESLHQKLISFYEIDIFNTFLLDEKASCNSSKLASKAKDLDYIQISPLTTEEVDNAYLESKGIQYNDDDNDDNENPFIYITIEQSEKWQRGFNSLKEIKEFLEELKINNSDLKDFEETILKLFQSKNFTNKRINNKGFCIKSDVTKSKKKKQNK